MLTKNFNISEFQSRDGSLMPEWVEYNVYELAKNLQIVRDYIGKPIHINSGYRSLSLNKKIGGVPNSYHTKGMAADIIVEKMPPKKLAQTIRKLIKEGKIKQGGIGLYDDFVHYDTRGHEARWDYSAFF